MSLVSSPHNCQPDSHTTVILWIPYHRVLYPPKSCKASLSKYILRLKKQFFWDAQAPCYTICLLVHSAVGTMECANRPIQ